MRTSEYNKQPVNCYSGKFINFPDPSSGHSLDGKEFLIVRYIDDGWQTFSLKNNNKLFKIDNASVGLFVLVDSTNTIIDAEVWDKNGSGYKQALFNIENRHMTKIGTPVY